MEKSPLVQLLLDQTPKNLVRQMYSESFENGYFNRELFFENVSQFPLVSELFVLAKKHSEPTKEELLAAQLRAYHTTQKKHPDILSPMQFEVLMSEKQCKIDEKHIMHLYQAYNLVASQPRMAQVYSLDEQRNKKKN